MKKTLTIILLSISLSGFSQTMKGDFVITPTVGRGTFATSSDIEKSISQVRFPLDFHKYLSDRLAVGINVYFFYECRIPNTTNQFYQSATRINISPEVRYNFLKTRLTPFITGRFVDVGYESRFYDNPAIAVAIRRLDNTYFSTSFQMSLGISYFIKERFGLQLAFVSFYNTSDGFRTQFYVPYNIGLQFIINNPRQ